MEEAKLEYQLYWIHIGLELADVLLGRDRFVDFFRKMLAAF